MRDALLETDMILVRTGNRIDAVMLEGTPVRYVGTATAGFDHVDRSYLAAKGIPFAHAPGCNAESVVEYVMAALGYLSERYGEELVGKKVGIVGCGQVGGRLASRLPALGMDVLRCDPPVAASGAAGPFVSFETVLESADILTFHTPLVRSGPHATAHMLDASAMRRVRPGAWLINASRGEVVDGTALIQAMDAGRFGAAVLDVWEGEPEVSLELMRRVDLATPHIAGHSFEGKVNGTIQLYETVQQWLGVPGTWDIEAALAPEPGDRLDLGVVKAEEADWRQIVRRMYDIAADDRVFRVALDLPAEEQAAYFRQLRKAYPRRRTFSRFQVSVPGLTPRVRRALEEGLRIRLV